MSDFEATYRSSDDNKRNFNNCLIFVQRTFPDRSEEVQRFQAEAVYAISQVFFNQIIPSVLSQTVKFSDN